MSNKYEQLALIKEQIATLKEQEDELREELFNEMMSKGETKVNTRYGTVSIAKKKCWSYPEHIREMEIDLKDAKKKAQVDGEYSTMEYLQFRPKEVEERKVTRGKIH